MVRVVKDLAQNDFAGFDNLLMRAIGFQDNKALHLIAGTGQTQALDSYVPDFLIRGGLSKAIRELHTHIQSVYARIGGFSKAPEWNGGNIFRSWYLSVQDYACEDWDLFAEKYQLNRRLIQGSYDVVFYGRFVFRSFQRKKSSIGLKIIKATGNKSGKTFYDCSNFPTCTFAAWKKEDIK